MTGDFRDLLDLAAKFDPAEPRDDAGRWLAMISPEMSHEQALDVIDHLPPQSKHRRTELLQAAHAARINRENSFQPGARRDGPAEDMQVALSRYMALLDPKATRAAARHSAQRLADLLREAHTAPATVGAKAYDPAEPRDHMGKWTPIGQALKLRPTRGDSWEQVEASINAKHPDYLDRLTADTVYGRPLPALQVTPDKRVVGNHAALLAAVRAGKQQVLVHTVSPDSVGAKAFDPSQPRDEHGRWSRVAAALEDLSKAPHGVGQGWHDVTLAKHAGMGASPQERQQISEVVRDVLKDHQVWTRVGRRALDHILDDGRFKSQHESYTSGGALDQRARAVIEKVLHGVDPDIHDPVIYGYASPSPHGDLTDDAYLDPLGQYGHIALRLKPEVRDRSTVTFGDSLDDSGIALAGNMGGIDGDTGAIANENWAQQFSSFAPSPLSHPTHLALPSGHVTPFGLEAMKYAQQNGGIDPLALSKAGYIEAQIHDGVKASDIAEAVVTDQHARPDLLATLQKHKIPYKVVAYDDPFDPDAEDAVSSEPGMVVIDSWAPPAAKSFATLLDLVASYGQKFDPTEHRDWRGRWVQDEIAPAVVGARAEQNTEQWMAERGLTRESLAKNTNAILDRADPEALEYGHAWYGNAHNVAQGIAAKYGVPHEQACAVLAALSPRNKWRYDDDPRYLTHGNIADAHKVLAAVVPPPVKTKVVTAAKAALVKKNYKIDISHLVGKAHLTSDLTPAEQAALDPRVGGLPDNLTKAFRLARGEGSPHEVLGGPKVRSFYNNIRHVNDSRSATIDSHQVRAMIGRIDLPDKVYEEIASNPARYQFFADIVRQVADERHLPPHVVQAITWEQWRREHPEDVREAANPSNIATARDIRLGSVVYPAPTVAKTPKKKDREVR